MSRYSVGLRNVGSYKVSGQPYITGSAVNAGSEVKIEFPFVTKNITIRIPSPPNTAGLKEGGVFYLTTNETIGFGHSQGSNGKIPAFGGGVSDWTYSFWWRSPSWSKNQILAGIQRDPALGSLVAGKIRHPNTNAGQTGLKFTVDDGGVSYDAYHTNGGVALTNDRWYHVVVTQLTSSSHIYIDAVTSPGGKMPQMVSSSTDARFGWNSSNLQAFTASFDETTFFHTGMTNTEVSELYNHGEWFDPRKHSKAANLTCWWTMGDHHRDTPISQLSRNPPDSGVSYDAIYDVIDTSEENMNLWLLGGPTALDQLKTFRYVEGPFTSQTTGKLRVHMLSTTSSPHGANVFGNKHFRELQGYGSTITLPMKTKELYLSAVDAQMTFEIIAELTNIPTNSMYALTGSGIDE